MSKLSSGSSGKKEIYKCRLIAHDYLFFSTFGFRDTNMTNYIGNYALMYAINRTIQEIQRNASGTIPHYMEDTLKMRIYTTPAYLDSSPNNTIPLSDNSSIKWETQPQIYVTFNSINTITQLTENSRINLPQIGRKSKFSPLNSFTFFAIGGKPTGIVRLGKKQVSCRIFSKPLQIKESNSNTFHPSHPVNIEDIKKLQPTDLKNAELIKQTPPLIVNAYLKAEHYVCFDETGTYNILKPDIEKYQMAAFPDEYSH